MLAVIGGTGFAQMQNVTQLAEHPSSTPLGLASSPVLEARLQEKRVLFLARHGQPHSLPPHKINYRANVLALKAAGATQVLAINAVGSMVPAWKAPSLVLPDQLIDYTWGRESTYFDGDYRPLDHIDFSYPYSQNLRSSLLRAAKQLGISLHDGGTYAATQGPRLETAGEIQRFIKDGCHLVGMTGMPEAALARELELPYASLCLVVNAAAGMNEEEITLESMQCALSQGVAQVHLLLEQLLISSG